MDLGSFARFIEIATLSAGQTTNVSGIARGAAISRETARGYFEVLVDTLVGSWLPAYRPRAKVKEVALSKFYWFDPGVLRAAAGGFDQPLPSDFEGVLFEHLVLHELQSYLHYSGTKGSLGYWGTPSGSEVDFIFWRGQRAVAIEAKHGRQYRPEYRKGIAALPRANEGRQLHRLSRRPRAGGGRHSRCPHRALPRALALGSRARLTSGGQQKIPTSRESGIVSKAAAGLALVVVEDELDAPALCSARWRRPKNLAAGTVRQVFVASAVLWMMTRANWPALRRSRNWCAVATTGMALFLAAWQFLVPAGPEGAADDSAGMWAWVVALALSFPNALVLGVSAGRLLWRARRKSVVWVPVAVLLATAFGLPSLAASSGFAMEVVLWSFPLGLSISLGFSVCVILFTPTPNGPKPRTPDPRGDEEHAYSRDLVSEPPHGEGQP